MAEAYTGLKGALLRFLKVPSEPDAPAGHEGTLRTFRAAPSYFRYKLALWGIGQFFTVVVAAFLVFGLVAASIQEGGLPGCAFTFIMVGGLFFILFQLLLSFLAVRLDYEMRWYLVTDQSLRIREGVFNVREMTMTFANIQNISISQGPLQRLLGVSDLEVKSAGGGGAQHPQQAGMLSMHTGYFRGVDNAEELRDLMRERMRKAKGAGLGDPDDEHDDVSQSLETPGAVLAAVLEEMRLEARALRAAVEARSYPARSQSRLPTRRTAPRCS